MIGIVSRSDACMSLPSRLIFGHAHLDWKVCHVGHNCEQKCGAVARAKHALDDGPSPFTKVLLVSLESPKLFLGRSRLDTAHK